MLANAPDCPPGCEQLWKDFIHLHGKRGSNGFGVSRITDRDLLDFMELRGVRFSSWELDALQQLDTLWLSEFAPKPKEDE